MKTRIALLMIGSIVIGSCSKNGASGSEAGEISESSISIEEVPQAAVSFTKEKYAGYTLEEAEKIETKDGIFYEVELKGNGQELELKFDANGNLVNSGTEEDDDTGEKEDGDDD